MKDRSSDPYANTMKSIPCATGSLELIRWALFIVGSTTLGLVVSAQTTEGTHRPNVLFVIIDDLNTNIACYGDAQSVTPNLDRLADRSVLFERAYCQYPLCGPSRASFLTGLRPDSTKVLANAHDYRKTIPDAVTLPAYFRKHGYVTSRVGSKVFHYAFHGGSAGDSFDDPQAWDKKSDLRGRDLSEEDQAINYTPDRNIGGALAWLAADGVDEEQTDGIAATEAIKLLRQHSESQKPFFLALGLYRPHVPCIATERYFAMHPHAEVRLPNDPAGHLRDVPELALHVKPPNYDIAADDLRRFKQAYYASVSFVDAQLGRVIDAMRELKLDENTIVVVFGDHGWLLGQHGQWQKTSLWEEATRVPLLISAPGVSANRRRCPRTVELIDLYPTLADLCGLEIPAALEGKSLHPLLVRPDAPRDRPAYTQLRVRVVSDEGTNTVMGRSVRTQRWRYTEWDEGQMGAQLYDHDRDSRELRNLVEDAQHVGTVTRLHKLLNAVID